MPNEHGNRAKRDVTSLYRLTSLPSRLDRRLNIRRTVAKILSHRLRAEGDELVEPRHLEMRSRVVKSASVPQRNGKTLRIENVAK